MSLLVNLKKDLQKAANKKRSKKSERFFKTGKGEYGEGDIFIGVKMSVVRSLAKKYQDLPTNNVLKLLRSKIHEERAIALIILTHQFKKGGKDIRKKICRLYIINSKYINNWDLVDISAHKILGSYLLTKPKTVLYKLVKSKNLWDRRIAIIATFSFIHKNDFVDSLRISKILLNDKEDLIHKAAGWMLREVGNRNRTIEEKFLKKYYLKMPRTMLRYAIEKFPKNKYQAYLKGRI